MTHGDKEKATAAKSSKASGQKPGAESGENGKSHSAGQSGKAASEAGQGGDPAKAAKSGGSSVKAGPKSTDKAAAGKKGGTARDSASGRADTKTKGGAAVEAGPISFNNPVISSAFEQVLQKYPNALRKLTD